MGCIGMDKNGNLLSALEREAMLAVEALEEARLRSRSEEKAKEEREAEALSPKDQQKTSNDGLEIVIQEEDDNQDTPFDSLSEDETPEYQCSLPLEVIDDAPDEPSMAEVLTDLVPKEDGAKVAIGRISPISRSKLMAQQTEPYKSENGETCDSDMYHHMQDLELQLAAAQNQAARASADFENYKKRTLRDQKLRCQQQQAKIVTDFLSVIDNFERAIAHAKQSQNFDNLLQGIELTGKLFLSALAKNGCQPFDSIGELFDPHYHEVLQRMDTKDHAHNSIVQEHLRGYMMHERVLRPALVVVAQHLNDLGKGDND